MRSRAPDHDGTPVDARALRAAATQRLTPGAPVDSLRSTHARVAALSRFRPADDSELTAARSELAACKDQTRALRARISSLPPETCAQLLSTLGGPGRG